MEILNKNGKLSLLEVKVPKSKASNERATAIEYFVEPLISARTSENLKRFDRWRLKNRGKTAEDFKKTKLSPTDKYLQPLTAQKVAILLSHLKTVDDLYQFFSSCNRYAKGDEALFSRAFFGSLKVKK